MLFSQHLVILDRRLNHLSATASATSVFTLSSFNAPGNSLVAKKRYLSRRSVGVAIVHHQGDLQLRPTRHRAPSGWEKRYSLPTFSVTAGRKSGQLSGMTVRSALARTSCSFRPIPDRRAGLHCRGRGDCRLANRPSTRRPSLMKPPVNQFTAVGDGSSPCRSAVAMLWCRQISRKYHLCLHRCGVSGPFVFSLTTAYRTGHVASRKKA